MWTYSANREKFSFRLTWNYKEKKVPVWTEGLLLGKGDWVFSEACRLTRSWRSVFFFFENAARWFWVPEFMVILQMIGKYIQMCISCVSSGNADLGGSPRHFTKGLWAPIMQVNNWLKISQLGIIGYYWVLLSIIWVLLRIIWVLLFCFFLLFLILWVFFFQLKGETICWLKMQCLHIH